MFKHNPPEIKVKSHRDGESYTLKQLLVRIEDLEEKNTLGGFVPQTRLRVGRHGAGGGVV